MTDEECRMAVVPFLTTERADSGGVAQYILG